MTEDNKKIITVTYALSCVLLGFVVSLLMSLLATHFAFFARLETQTVFSNGVPVVVGLATFLFLQFNPTTVDFLDGVIGELKKVVWPTKKDTWLMTIVVVITLILSGVLVGLYDLFWAKVIELVVK
ncbi:MAG: preprotein translocase subunit SecE [Oligoflexia bacterium]|nr:preprotein translocase subunit SecE [Oligoflexia bacterium]